MNYPNLGAYRRHLLALSSPKDVYLDAAHNCADLQYFDMLHVAIGVCNSFHSAEGFRYARRLYRLFEPRPTTGWWTTLAWISRILGG